MPEERGRVLVTDAGRGSAVSIIRSLGRANWHVIAGDADQYSPGFYSNYAHRALRYTSPANDSKRFVDELVQLARTERLDIIIPVTDEAILPLAAGRSRFPRSTQLAIPNDEQLRAVHDKVATLTLAERLGVPIPRTELVTTVGEAARHCRRLGWPVVLKPRHSRVHLDNRIIARQVQYASSLRELADAFASAGNASEFLLQEYWPGEGHGVELLLDRGEPRLAFQHRRLREVPPSGGPSSYREAVSLDPLLLEHATLLLRELGWTGLAMVEFKCGVRGARLMEINGRIWGSLPLAVASGVDFPLHLAELMMGRTLSDLPSSYVIGRKRRNMELEVAWVAQVLFSKRDSSEPASRTPRRRALALLIELSLAWREMDNYWEDDLRPLAAEVLRAAGRLQRKLGFHLVRTQWPLSQALRRLVERIFCHI